MHVVTDEIVFGEVGGVFTIFGIVYSIERSLVVVRRHLVQFLESQQ